MAERLKIEIWPDRMTPGPPGNEEWQPTGEPRPLTADEWQPTGAPRSLSQPSLGGKVLEETRRAIAKADRDYIIPMIGLPADIVGWALDTEKGLPGGTEWWNKLPGIGNVPEPETRAGKLGAEVLGQGTTGLVQGGAIGKTVQAGGQALGAIGRQAAGTALSKVGGQIADPTANAASALGSAAAGQGLESIVPEGFEKLAHGVGSVLGGAAGGGFTAAPSSTTAVDKAFDAYQRLGLHPSASMVGVGGRTAELLEGNVLPSALGSAGKMHNFATETMDKFQSVKDNIASQFGAPRTKYAMGKDARETVAQGFQARKEEGGNLLNAVGQAFGPNDTFIPKNLNRAIFKPVGTAGATDAVQSYANDPEITEIKNLLDQTAGSLSWADMLAIKTKLGNKLEQGYAVPVNKAQISQLVTAIDNDMKAAVESIGNPDTVRDWEHGKAIYNNAMRDYEKAFSELLGTKDLPLNPEAVYRIMMGRGDIKSTTADIEAFETVWRQLGKAKQGELAATVLAHMGNTDPEKMGDVTGFSLATFLTSYKNLSPAAKQMLFRSTGNAQLEQALDDLLFAADKIGGWNKVASTSRSQISGTMMGQMGALAGVAATADWLTALKFAALDIGGPAAAAWTLTNPKGIRAIANALNKANEAAIGAARGVMAINPPRNVAPGQNIPSSTPQQNPAGGNQVPGKQSSLPQQGQVLSDASPDLVRPGAQYAANEPQSVLSAAGGSTAEPGFLFDADQAAEARGAAAQRQRQAVKPAEGRQESEATSSFLDMAIPGRSVVRSLGEGEYGRAGLESAMYALPAAGKAAGAALEAAMQAAPKLTKLIASATGALTGLLTGSEAGKIPLDPEQRKRLQMEQQSLKQKQDAAEAAAKQRLQEAEQKAKIDAEAAERSAKTETERQKLLAEIENNKQREQAEIIAKRHKEEEDAAQRSLDASKAESKRMAERPFREKYPEAALGLTMGGMAVAAMLPTLSNAQKAAALNKYIAEWKKLDAAAAKALESGTAQEKQIAVQRLSDASNKWVETKERLSKPSSTGTKLAYGMAGAEGAALPAEIDFGLQPKESEAHKSAEEFFTNPMEMARVIATYLGGTMAGMTASKYPFKSAEPPVGSGGLIKAWEEQKIAEKKAAAAAKSAETRAKKKAEAEKTAKKEPEEPRKAKVPKDGQKIYGLRE